MNTISIIAVVVASGIVVIAIVIMSCVIASAIRSKKRLYKLRKRSSIKKVATP